MELENVRGASAAPEISDQPQPKFQQLLQACSHLQAESQLIVKAEQQKQCDSGAEQSAVKRDHPQKGFRPQQYSPYHRDQHLQASLQNLLKGEKALPQRERAHQCDRKRGAEEGELDDDPDQPRQIEWPQLEQPRELWAGGGGQLPEGGNKPLYQEVQGSCDRVPQEIQQGD